MRFSRHLPTIIYADSGTISVCGRVSSLLELGAGFHPDMSGRENIYINASIFGLNKKEIDQRMEDIIEFSELRDYIDNPVRTGGTLVLLLELAAAVQVKDYCLEVNVVREDGLFCYGCST